LGDPLADFAYLAMNWAMPSGDRPARWCPPMNISRES
jgi:aminoglycoside phosphotransferase (APT) family kinase protein